MGRPHIYPEEFRREACELVRRGDRSQRQIAADLGIPDQTLNNWMKAESHAKVRANDPNALYRSLASVPYRRVGVLLPDRGPGLPHPSRGDQDGLEVHDERAAMIVDGRADAFEQTVSDCLFEGGVIAS